MKSIDVDLLHGPIFKSLVIFAIPLFISNVFQQLYNTVDTMIVGYYLGEVSLAAIGSCSSIYELLVGFALGIGNGLAIVVGRSYGSGDEQSIKKSVASSIIIGIVSSLIISILGSMILYPLLEILNTPSEIIAEAYSYISLITLFIIVMFAYNLCAALMRAIGNSVVPLFCLVISSLLNIVLDFIFITQLNMGVSGAAVATVLAQGISALLCLIYIINRVSLLIPKRSHYKIDKELYKEMLTQGYAMGFMGSIVSAGSVILQYGINGLGYLTIAGHSAARKLYAFFNLPFTSMALADSTFVSQNKGANQPGRVRQALKYSYIYDIIMAVLVSIILWLFAPDLVHLVSGSDEAVLLNNGAMYLRVVGPFYAVLGILVETRYALQGIGQKMLPLISSVIEFVGKIIFVVTLIPVYQYKAVIFCEPVIWCVMAIELVVSFYRHPFIRDGKNVKE